MRARGIMLGLLLGLGLPWPARAGQVIDRVVAVISPDNHQGGEASKATYVVTLSGLEFEARVAIIKQGGTLAASAALPHELLASTLTYLIGQRLAYQEAEALKAVELDQSEVDQAVEAFAARLGGRTKLAAFLAEQEVPPGDLQALLRRDLAVSKFLDTQVRLEAKVSDAQLDAYLAAHPELLEGAPPREGREAVRNKLVKERSQQLVLQVLRRLRARARVRVVDPGFAGADAALQASDAPQE